MIYNKCNPKGTYSLALFNGVEWFWEENIDRVKVSPIPDGYVDSY